MEFMGYRYELSLTQNVQNLAIDLKSKSLNENLRLAVEYLVSINQYSDRSIFEAAKALIEEFSVDQDLLNDAKHSQHVKTVGRMLKDYL